MGKKEQIIALVDGDVKVGLDTLRMIGGQSRSRTLEDMIEPAVAAALAAQPELVERAQALADRAGLSLTEYVEAYARAFKGSTYPADLVALEKDDRMVTGKRAKPAPISHAIAA